MDEEQELGWLIRDTSNKIRGPYKQSEIVALIKKGQLKGKTEISRANSYWFALEEKTELGRFLPEFNGGKPPPEQPTQMTATLTEADIQEHMDITTFTAVPKEGTAGAPEGSAPAGGQIEWLSDEFAEEFGEDFGQTISIQTDASGISPAAEGAPPEAATDQQPTPTEQPTPRDLEKEREEKAREMLRRATVKADTLPSEHKSFHGERPKPIDTLMRSPGKPAASALKENHHATVSVPVEDSPAPKMFIEDDEGKQRDAGGKRNFLIFGAAAALIVLIGAALFVVPRSHSGRGPKEPMRKVRKGEEAAAAARESILTFDLEGAKAALADLELEPTARGEASTYLAQAVVKKEFLYDVEGAMLALQTARQQARTKRVEAEVDNLQGTYGFEHDPVSSLELLKRNSDAYKDDPVFRYNLALGYLRTSHPVEAITILESLIGTISNDRSLVEDVALAQGWALEAHCGSGPKDAVCSKHASEAEDAYLRALEANPWSAKAQLGLALYRLRHGTFKNAEGDFRAFIDLAPELDPPTRVMNFRKLSNNDFYAFAHSQIVDLNTPSQTSSKPSALIMTADAIVSAILGRTSEAGQILSGALSAAPGDPNVLKASAYLHWKDGQLNDVIDSLKDARDRGSYAVNLMLGKSYLKLNRRDLAEKNFRAVIEYFPNRSDGYSLVGDLLLPDHAEEAKNQFREALKKDPLDIIALRGLQRLNAAPPLTTELQKNLPF